MRTKLAIGAGAALAAVGGGVAVAANGSQADRQAIIDDAAKELGVEAEDLEAALRKALENRIDESVAAGRLTDEQATGLKERLREGGLPLGLRGLHAPSGGHQRGVGLEAAATHLGLTPAELRERLADGQSLADVAEAAGKSVDGLVDALVADATARLDEAVESGRLTDEQRDRMAETLEERIRERVEATGLRRGFRGGPGFGHGGPRLAPPAGEQSGYRFGGGAEPDPPAAA